MGDSVLDLLWGALAGEIVGTVLFGALLFAACNPEVKRQLPVEWGGGGQGEPAKATRAQARPTYPVSDFSGFRLL